MAVSSIDSQVDPIAVCVGYRGSRIKAVREELAGEHIDVVRFSDDPQVLIPNALQPATVEQVLLCDLIGRAIVLVQEDQLSLAIGRRGQNVRLASKLCGWDIEIMTATELEAQIERAVSGFCTIDGVTPEIAQSLVEQGYLSFDDLSVIEPDALMEMGNLTAEEVDQIVEQAEIRAGEAEEAAAEQKKMRKERERLGLDSESDADAVTDDQDSVEPSAESNELDDSHSADETESPVADLNGNVEGSSESETSHKSS